MWDIQITAGTVKQNDKESVKRLLCSGNAYSFMSSVVHQLTGNNFFSKY